jgi:hypothetical protein
MPPEVLFRCGGPGLALRDWVWEARRQRPSLRYLVIAGDDRVVPHYRATLLPTGDLDTGWRDESAYLERERGHIAVPSPIGRALAENQTLTDDVYGAKEPIAHRRPGLTVSSDLYVPELAVGRLVESPRDMTAVIEAYLRSGGELPVQSSLAAGWDAMFDGIADGDTLLEAAGLSAGERRRLLGDECRLAPLRSQLLDRRNDLVLLGLPRRLERPRHRARRGAGAGGGQRRQRRLRPLRRALLRYEDAGSAAAHTGSATGATVRTDGGQARLGADIANHPAEAIPAIIR